MNQTEIDKLELLANAATPEWKHFKSLGLNVISTVPFGRDTFQDRICDMISSAYRGDQTEKDAEFIAAASPTTILDLIKERKMMVEAIRDSISRGDDSGDSYNSQPIRTVLKEIGVGE